MNPLNIIIVLSTLMVTVRAGLAPIAQVAAPLTYTATPAIAAARLVAPPLGATASYSLPYFGRNYAAIPAPAYAPFQELIAAPGFAQPAPLALAAPSSPYIAAPVSKTYVAPAQNAAVRLASAPVFGTASAPFVAAPIAKTYAAPLASAQLNSLAAPYISAAQLYASPVAAQIPAQVPAPVAVPIAAKNVAPAAVLAKTAVAEPIDAFPQYKFAYNVQDTLTGDSKTQEESRDGNVVRGSYSLIEPDGSRRIVNYYADPYQGFNAIVQRDVPLAAVAQAAPLITKSVPAPIIV